MKAVIIKSAIKLLSAGEKGLKWARTCVKMAYMKRANITRAGAGVVLKYTYLLGRYYMGISLNHRPPPPTTRAGTLREIKQRTRTRDAPPFRTHSVQQKSNKIVLFCYQHPPVPLSNNCPARRIVQQVSSKWRCTIYWTVQHLSNKLRCPIYGTVQRVSNKYCCPVYGTPCGEIRATVPRRGGRFCKKLRKKPLFSVVSAEK